MSDSFIILLVLEIDELQNTVEVRNLTKKLLWSTIH